MRSSAGSAPPAWSSRASVCGIAPPSPRGRRSERRSRAISAVAGPTTTSSTRSSEPRDSERQRSPVLPRSSPLDSRLSTLGFPPTLAWDRPRSRPSKRRRDMTEKLRLGFAGHFQTQEVAVSPDDPAPWDPSTKFSILGGRVPRLDGKAKTTGEARYSIDIRLPGMLYGRILRCPLAAATVQSIDLSGARKAPGVRAAIPLAEAGEKIRFAAQEIAAVAAETPEGAEDAIQAIRVAYASRPFVASIDAAMASDAPLVFDGKAETKTSAGEVEGPASGLPRKGNVLGPRQSGKGDVTQGFAQADVIVEGTYVTQVQTHSALETHGVVARWEGDELTVWASTQGIFSVREELAQTLKVPASKIRVVTEYMGGGFGAKFGARIEGIAAA